jgi:Tfp pilus assembly protein PilN
MIEINLVPDVKQELLRAQKVRNAVISLSVVVSIIVVGIVVLLSVWIFLVQGVRGFTLDKTIEDRSKTLANVEDIENTLTIQNQLAKLQTMHDDKNIQSRAFDLLQVVNPPAPNDVRVTSLNVDAEEKSVTIQAQANGGFAALEVFKKTLAATTIKYTDDGEEQTVPLTESISDSERSFGEDANGAKVLRFTLSFTYPEQLFSNKVTGVTMQAPTKSNVTDSYLGVPQSLFVQKASDLKGDN